MFTITISHPEQGQKAIKLTTSNRNLARAAKQLGNENKLDVKVMVEVAPREVKFKNVP